MECCCRPTADTVTHPAACPACGRKGRPVERLTVKALLTERALGRLGPTAHRFCPEPGCHVVYYDEGGGVYTTGDLRVPVWQKVPAGTRVVCYCFGENEADIRTEILTTGRSGAVERVRAHVAAGRCACDVRNPCGACCLGDVTAAVDRMALDEEPSSTSESTRKVSQ